MVAVRLPAAHVFYSIIVLLAALAVPIEKLPNNLKQIFSLFYLKMLKMLFSVKNS